MASILCRPQCVKPFTYPMVKFLEFVAAVMLTAMTRQWILLCGQCVASSSQLIIEHSIFISDTVNYYKSLLQNANISMNFVIKFRVTCQHFWPSINYLANETWSFTIMVIRKLHELNVHSQHQTNHNENRTQVWKNSVIHTSSITKLSESCPTSVSATVQKVN